MVWMCGYNILCPIPLLKIRLLFYFRGAVQCFDTINENACFSYVLYIWEDNIPCAFEQERCCNVLKVGQSHKPNTSVGTRDFIHALHVTSITHSTWLHSRTPPLHTQLSRPVVLFIHSSTFRLELKNSTSYRWTVTLYSDGTVQHITVTHA